MTILACPECGCGEGTSPIGCECQPLYRTDLLHVSLDTGCTQTCDGTAGAGSIGGDGTNPITNRYEWQLGGGGCFPAAGPLRCWFIYDCAGADWILRSGSLVCSDDAWSFSYFWGPDGGPFESFVTVEIPLTVLSCEPFHAVGDGIEITE